MAFTTTFTANTIPILCLWIKSHTTSVTSFHFQVNFAANHHSYQGHSLDPPRRSIVSPRHFTKHSDATGDCRSFTCSRTKYTKSYLGLENYYSSWLTNKCSALQEISLFISSKLNFTGEQFLPFSQQSKPLLWQTSPLSAKQALFHLSLPRKWKLLRNNSLNLPTYSVTFFAYEVKI